MNLIPYHSETIVSSLARQEVLGHLMRVTREVNYLDSRSQQDQAIQFNGLIGQEKFRISRAIRKGETFLPLIEGKVESTPRGSIIFLSFRLFPVAIFFLVFWSVVLITFSFFYFFALENFQNALICLGLAFVNYALCLFFFHRQVKISREIFHQLINFHLKDKD